MSDSPSLYQHPLAYLIGLQGSALLRAYVGEYDRDFTMARLAEIRALLDAAEQLGEGGYARLMSPSTGYDNWAPVYDSQRNAMLDKEGPIVREILDGISADGSARAALDAACGTGRHSAHLASLGHTVTGVDTSPAMLERARAKVPTGDFREADLRHLPFEDDQFDIVVCALALVHVPDVAPVLAEFVRVLRPGGHLVISDARGYVPGGRSYPIVVDGPDGEVGYIPCWVHPTSEYLKTALALGLRLVWCEEPDTGYPLVDATGTPPGDVEPPPAYDASAGHPDIWSLHPWAPDATNASYRHKPHFIVLHFDLP